MALAYGSAGAASAAGTTSVSVPYPSSIAAGDLLVLSVAVKLATITPTTPSGWTLQKAQVGGNPNNNNSISNGGRVNLLIYTRVADGAETGSLAVTITGGNSAGARILRYTGSGTYTFGSSGGDFGYGFVSGTTISIETGSLANLDLAAGDIALVAYGSNSARIDIGQGTLAESGITFGTASTRSDVDSDKFTIGNNVSLYLVERAVTAGTATATPTATLTNSSFAADDPHGALIVFRMREASSGGTVQVGAAALDGNGTLTASGGSQLSASAAMAAEGTLNASVGGVLNASVAMTAEGTLSALAVGRRYATIGLDGNGTLTASGSRKQPGGTLTLSSIATLVAAAKLAARATAPLTATGTLTVSGIIIRKAAAALDGNATLTASPVVKLGGSAMLTAQGYLTAAYDGSGTVQAGAAALTAEGTLGLVVAKLTQRATVTLSADSAVTAVGTRVQGAAATLTAEGTVNATGTRIQGATVPGLLGSSTGTATASIRSGASATLAGVSTLSAEALSRVMTSADVAGTSYFSAAFFTPPSLGVLTMELLDLSTTADITDLSTTVELL